MVGVIFFLVTQSDRYGRKFDRVNSVLKIIVTFFESRPDLRNIVFWLRPLKWAYAMLAREVIGLGREGRGATPARRLR